MASVQSSAQIQGILSGLVGQEISSIQVLGINSLKSMTPPPEALTRQFVEAATVEDRLLTIQTATNQVVIDLQRTGKVVWLADAQPYASAAGSGRPTVRLILAGGKGIDLTEPAKTKRITVTVSDRP